MKKNKKDETYKLLMGVMLLLILILGGYIYFDKIRDLDRTINQIQEAIPREQVIDVKSDVLINKDVLFNALSEEELKTNFPSIVKNVYGFDVEYKCEGYNDVDGCNSISVVVKPFQLK